MKNLLLCCAMLVISSSAYADDTFSVDNITLPQNSNAPLAVDFSLDEGSMCSGYTFWIELPEELSFVYVQKVVGEETIITVPNTLGDCYEETPTFTPNLNDGYLKVGCLTGSVPLNKQSGTLVTFTITSDGTLAVGRTFTCKLHHATISDPTGMPHDVAATEFTVTIGEPVDNRILLDENSATPPTASEGAVDVRVRRALIGGVWNTICLPFAMTNEQVTNVFGNGVELSDFTGIVTTTDDDENVVDILVNFNDVTTIEANHPYIIKVENEITEFTVDGVEIVPDEENATVDCDEFVTGTGTKRDPYVYHYNSFVGNYSAGTVIPELCLFIYNNNFCYSMGTTEMLGYRGYFDFYDVLSDVENATVRIAIGGQTGITEVGRIEKEDGRYYTLDGRRIAKPGHGVYVKDGRKVIVK